MASAAQLKRLAAIRDRFAAEAGEAERFLKELQGHKEELAQAYGVKELNLGEFRAAKAALEKRRGEVMAAVRRGKALDELTELTPAGRRDLVVRDGGP